MNPLGDQGIELILKAVATHPSLHFLGIEVSKQIVLGTTLLLM